MSLRQTYQELIAAVIDMGCDIDEEKEFNLGFHALLCLFTNSYGRENYDNLTDTHAREQIFSYMQKLEPLHEEKTFATEDVEEQIERLQELHSPHHFLVLRLVTEQILEFGKLDLSKLKEDLEKATLPCLPLKDAAGFFEVTEATIEVVFRICAYEIPGFNSFQYGLHYDEIDEILERVKVVDV